MAQEPGRPFTKYLLSPWGIALVLLAVFALGEGYLSLRDSVVDQALELYQPFAAPAFDLSFAKTIQYDPLTFVGKGAQAGLWKWTPEALVLTDEGQKYFEDSGGKFISRASAGKRRIVRIRTNESTSGGGRRIGFLYEWTEVSPPAAALLNPPPKLKEEYPGIALVQREGSAWKVESLQTQDYDEALKKLQDAASGVLK